jgi:hypothetical protein
VPGRLRGTLVVLVVALAFGAVACGGDSGYDYVSNNGAGLYFRVPNDWTVFDIDTNAGRVDAVVPASPWIRVLDASATPSESNYLADIPTDPVGIAEIQPLQLRRDAVNLSALRALALDGQGDPVQLVEEGSNPNIELVSLEDRSTSDGFRGERMVFNFQVSPGQYVTIDQTALMNNDLTEIYRLLIKCESACYEDHRSEINGIVDSWTIDQED